MRPLDTLVAVATLGLLAGLARLAERCAASRPRVSAAAGLVSLLGWGAVPVAWLACAGGGLDGWIGRLPAASRACHTASASAPWALVGYLPALGALGWLLGHGASLARAARRAELRGPALAAAVPRDAANGTVWVVPSRELAAYAGGLWRPRAILTSGLLAPLSAPERQAVCEHEAAHVRLGHPRLLLVAGAVAAAYGWLPPVRHAWDRLRRDLEAAADDAAVAVVGRTVLVSALARIALVTPAGPGPHRGEGPGLDAGAGAGGHLHYRLARLGSAPPARRVSAVALGSLAGLVALLLGWSLCLLGGADPSAATLGGCVGALWLLALRPAWPLDRPGARA